MAKHPIRLQLAEGQIEAFIETPDGPYRLVDLAYQVLGLSSAVAEMGERAARRNGVFVSCTKGCGVCCRQLVPVAPPEAAFLYELVEAMDDPQKSTIKQRFAVAVDQLERTGLIKKLEDPANPLLYKAEEDYFRQAIPCPFLENEACSIYPFRPSRCREYLVFTPPDRCADPYRQKIGRLPVSLHLNEALTWLWASLVKAKPRYIPLVLSLKWSQQNQKTRKIGADPKHMLESLCRNIEDISKNVEREALRKN
jgi:Fe-S-cluster containining protein